MSRAAIPPPACIGQERVNLSKAVLTDRNGRVIGWTREFGSHFHAYIGATHHGAFQTLDAACSAVIHADAERR